MEGKDDSDCMIAISVDQQPLKNAAPSSKTLLVYPSWTPKFVRFSGKNDELQQLRKGCTTTNLISPLNMSSHRSAQ